MEQEKKITVVDRGKEVYARYEKFVPASFFILGFLFDIFTLGRIDSMANILQQAVYLILCLWVLVTMFFDENPNIENRSKILRKYYEFRVPILHFLFGSLLSAYTIFYFKSSSFVISFAFLLGMVGLLVANEFKKVQDLGLSFKFALFALCLFSYCAYVFPIIFGTIGLMTFVFSLLVGSSMILILVYFFKKKEFDQERIMKEILRPSGIVLASFLVLYVFRLIPPVPLSIQYVGVFHGVGKNQEGQYVLSHERPFWKVWHNGDQSFEAQDGDQIYVFFRLFSPSDFADTVKMVWLYDDPRQGWMEADSIPIEIVGGREEGFRGYGVKSNYMNGDWKVVIETTDGREIGRVNFEVEKAPTSQRQFKTLLQ